MIYRTEIKRAENHPATGRAQYRVTASWPDWLESSQKSVIAGGAFFPGYALLKTNKSYRRSNLISPRKALGIKRATR